jgi:hypothetical protein
MTRILCACLLLPTLAFGATIDMTAQSQATLATAQATTGPSANEASFGMAGQRSAAVFQVQNTAGTATAVLEFTCLTTGGAGTGWVQVANTSTALTVGGLAWDVIAPGCRYRTNVTACSGCAVTATAVSIGK